MHEVRLWERVRRWNRAERDKDRLAAVQVGWRAWLVGSVITCVALWAVLLLLAALGFDVWPLLSAPLVAVAATGSSRLHHRRRHRNAPTGGSEGRG